MAHHPCGLCTVHVLDTDEAIQCDGPCSLWHHRECLGMTLDVYLKLSRGHEDWFCGKCKKIKREIKQEVDVEARRRLRGSGMGKTKVECKKLDFFTESQRCVFCNTQNIDELKYGPVYIHKNIITHYYCVLLSSNMGQNGRDCDGILGFLPNDINKEVKRGMRLHCSFCRGSGATLGCDIPRCKVVFHLPCGINHGTLHQFFGEFKSFCAKHRPVQSISQEILAESSKNAMCGICYEKVVPRPIHETLWAPCCKKSAFFHRDCVQKLATSAGYFFKCPLCNNKEVFQQTMREFGIYIPEQDASWECVPHAYQDLLVRHDTCDSENCSCPLGRKTNVEGTRWELILCKFCGSQGIHIGCGRLKWKSPEFACDACSLTNNETENRNARNYNGDRHRLSSGRDTNNQPSAPVEVRTTSRENEPTYSDSSDDSSDVLISNRRRKVVSPLPQHRHKSPPKKNISLESKGKSTVSSIEIKDDSDDERPLNSRVILIDDSDDDVELVTETKGTRCLKTIDGSTIEVVQMESTSVNKRPRVENDIQIPMEVVELDLLMEGTSKKMKAEDNPATPQPSTSTSFSAPSTSYVPPDLNRFVLVDSATLRPEELPPGMVLLRSVQPVHNVPQLSAPTNVPVQYFSCDANSSWGPPVVHMPNIQIAVNTGPGAATISAPSTYSRAISRKAAGDYPKPGTDKRNCFGRRRGGRRDFDRLNATVVVSPLKFRISNNGHYEVSLPQKRWGVISLKRKGSPLPSRPLKKLKYSETINSSVRSPSRKHKNESNSSALVSVQTGGPQQRHKENRGKGSKCKRNITVSSHNINDRQDAQCFLHPSKEKKLKKIITKSVSHCGDQKSNAGIKNNTKCPKMKISENKRPSTIKNNKGWRRKIFSSSDELRYRKIDFYLKKFSKHTSKPTQLDSQESDSNVDTSHMESKECLSDLIDQIICKPETIPACENHVDEKETDGTCGMLFDEIPTTSENSVNDASDSDNIESYEENCSKVTLMEVENSPSSGNSDDEKETDETCGKDFVDQIQTTTEYTMKSRLVEEVGKHVSKVEDAEYDTNNQSAGFEKKEGHIAADSFTPEENCFKKENKTFAKNSKCIFPRIKLTLTKDERRVYNSIHSINFKTTKKIKRLKKTHNENRKQKMLVKTSFESIKNVRKIHNLDNYFSSVTTLTSSATCNDANTVQMEQTCEREQSAATSKNENVDLKTAFYINKTPEKRPLHLVNCNIIYNLC